MTMNDRLNQAIEAMQAETQEGNAPPEVLERTVSALIDQWGTSEQSHPWWQVFAEHRHSRWRWVAAAIILLMVGFTVGQFSVSGQLNRRLDQWQSDMEQQVAARLRHELLQTQQAQWVQAASQFNQGLDQRFNELATGMMNATQVTQQQSLLSLAQAVYNTQIQQQKQIAQLLGQLENRQLYRNAVLADGLVTVANATQENLRQTDSLLSLLAPDPRNESAPLPAFDPNRVQP